MNWAQIGQWLATLGVAAVISAAVAWPKSRGEGQQASGAGQLSLTQAQVQAQENALRSAESAASRAEAACTKCEQARETMEANFKKFIGFVDEELVSLLPDPEARARTRRAIREAWESI